MCWESRWEVVCLVCYDHINLTNYSRFENKNINILSGNWKESWKKISFCSQYISLIMIMIRWKSIVDLHQICKKWSEHKNFYAGAWDGGWAPIPVWLSIILYLYRYQTTQSTKDLLQCPLCYFIINFQYKLSEANLLLLWQNWGGKTERISNSISTTFFFNTFPSMFGRGILNALCTCKQIRYTRYTRIFQRRQVFYYCRIIRIVKQKRVEECPSL